MYSELIRQKEDISDTQMQVFLQNLVDDYDNKLTRVLIIPPDFTRFHSNAGRLTEILFNKMKDQTEVSILPALGTHSPLTEEERQIMFGTVPKKAFITHDWRNGVVKLGTIPSEFVKEISEEKVKYPIDIEISRHLKENFDLIISVGQVVPHEVAGMANGYKNILVGTGGSDIINKSHFLGACYGMERIMGRIENPVRALFDFAYEEYLEHLPIIYVNTVTQIDNEGNNSIFGLFCGEKDTPFRKAAELSQKINIFRIKKPLDKIVVFLDPREYKSTWVGNKAIYRTRMAIKENGELFIVAPGLKRFGEDKKIDTLIRKYGYIHTAKILDLTERNLDLRNNLSAAAHLIHGSTDNRFKVTYCTDTLSEEEILAVNFNYQTISEVQSDYSLEALNEGYNSLSSGESIYFIRNPSLGLWITNETINSAL